MRKNRCGSANTARRLLSPAEPIMYFAAHGAKTGIMCIRNEEKTNKKNKRKTRILTQTGDEKYAQQFF